MRKITLEKVINKSGEHLIAVKKGPFFNTGDIIKLITPDVTYHAIFGNSDTYGVCTGCLFEATRLQYGIKSCPTFKDDSLLCVHTRDKDTRFMPLDKILESL